MTEQQTNRRVYTSDEVDGFLKVVEAKNPALLQSLDICIRDNLPPNDVFRQLSDIAWDEKFSRNSVDFIYLFIELKDRSRVKFGMETSTELGERVRKGR